jgi:hypothetical protein
MSDSGRYMAVTRNTENVTFEGNVSANVEYTEGATDATITGQAFMWEDTSDTLRAVSAAKPLPIGDAGGSLTVDNGGTFAVQVSSIAAGSNAIGKLAANSGVDIGDVDVTSVITGTGATNLGKAEDNAHTTADVGVAVLAVRRDSASSGVDTDGDYAMLSVNSDGALRTVVTGSGDATAANQVTGNALLTTIDDDTSTLVAATVLVSGVPTGTDRGVPAIFVRDDALSDLGAADGDFAIPKVNQRGATWAALDTVLDATNDSVSLDVKAGIGATVFLSIDLDESEEEIKATAASLYSFYFYNANASLRYLKFYDATAANVTVGTTTPVMVYPMPPTSAGTINFPHPAKFATALTAAATTGLAHNDTGAPSANDVILNVLYK